MWQPAELVDARAETPTARTLRLRVQGWPGHLPGQHIDVRLTAADGYQAERSYSLAAPTDGDLIDITVQTVTDGEVSPYLVDGLSVGDLIEIRGPVGGWFVWNPDTDRAAVLIGAGSGIVPLMAMLRARRNSRNTAPFRVLYSLRSPENLYYRDELLADRDDSAADEGPPREDIAVFLAYTRATPPGYLRPPSRLTDADLKAHTLTPAPEVTCYVCGPTPFVEATATALVALGHDPAAIRTERFGPSGK